jgi:hypothetical protein
MKEEAKTQEQDASQVQDPKMIEDLINKKIDEINQSWEQKLETQKNEIAGLNKANSKLQKELEAKELEKLDAKTRAQQEIELAQKEKEKILQETEEIKRQRIIETAVFDAGLPKDFAKRINGANEEEIAKDVKALTAYFEAEVNKRVEVEVNKRLGGKVPQGGTPPDLGDLQTAFNKAKEKGDMPQMIAIKRQASKDGIILNE